MYTVCRAWSRHCATSPEVPGSIPGGVTGDFFPWYPPTQPCALRSTQPLKASTRDFSWGKGGRCVWLTTYHPCSAETSRKSGALTYPESLGPPRPVRETFTFYTVCIELYVLQDLYPLVLYQKCILELRINEWMNSAAHVSGCVEVVKELNLALQPSDD